MTPALSSETYRAPSGPKVRSAGLPIVCAPFKNPDMKSSSPIILSPLTFNLTTLYPTGLELFHEPWKATNKSPCQPSGNCFEFLKAIDLVKCLPPAGRGKSTLSRVVERFDEFQLYRET